MGDITEHISIDMYEDKDNSSERRKHVWYLLELKTPSITHCSACLKSVSEHGEVLLVLLVANL